MFGSKKNQPQQDRPAGKLLPAYENLGDEQKGRVDALVANANTRDPLAGLNFGSGAAKELTEATAKIEKQLSAEMFSDFHALMDHHKSQGREIFLSWQKDLNAMLGVKEARSFFKSIFNAAAKPKTGEQAAAERDRIEQKLRDSIIAFLSQKRKLEMVRDFTIPSASKKIDDLERIHDQAYDSIVIHMIAAQRLAENLEKEIAVLEENPEKMEEAYEKAEFLRALQVAQSVLLQHMASHVNGKVGISSLREITDQTKANVSFLLDVEMDIVHQKIRHASHTIDNLRSADMVERIERPYQAQLDRMKKKSEHVSAWLEKHKEKPEALSPEQLERAGQDLEKSRQELEKRGQALANFRAAVKKQAEKLQEDGVNFQIAEAQAYAAWSKGSRSGAKPDSSGKPAP